MYSRFTVLDSFTEEDLEKLQDSTAAVVGLGATGSVIAEHLARHGVNLILIDRDYLEQNDLYSSNIYNPEQCEKSLPKAKAAGEYLSQFTDIETYTEHLDGSNIDLLDSADIILDGTDNLETRLLLNEYSKKTETPWIYTAAIAERGYSMLFDQKCFSCIFEDIDSGSLGTCETEGIMRETASIAASKSAVKAVKYLTGREIEEKLDTARGESMEVENPGCEVCEGDKYSRLESSGIAVSVCGENKYQLKREVSEAAFERLRESGEVIADNSYLTRISLDEDSFALFRSGRAIIEARNEDHARARFDEVVGS